MKKQRKDNDSALNRKVGIAERAADRIGKKHGWYESFDAKESER